MFDPYHKWLGIPKDQRPPTHYQILGVAPAERDPEVIEEAAIRQTTHVRAYQIGQHAADCTRLLKEIATARLTLLDPAKRQQYDAQLARAAQAAPANHATAITPHAPPPARQDVRPAPAAEIESLVVAPPTPGTAVMRSALPLGVLIGAGAGVALLLVLAVAGGAAYLFFASSPAEVAPKNAVAVRRVGKEEPQGPRGGEPKKKPAEPPKQIEEPAPAKKVPIQPHDPVPAPPAPPANTPPTTVLAAAGGVAPRQLVDLPDVRGEALLMPDGGRIVYMLGQPGVLRYREAPTFADERTCTIQDVNGPILPRAGSRDGTMTALVPADQKDRRILLWDWNRMAVAATLQPELGAYQVAVAPDMQHLATMGLTRDKGKVARAVMQVFRLSPPYPEVLRAPLDRAPTFLSFTPDSSQVFVPDRRVQRLRLYQVRGGAMSETTSPAAVHQPTFSATARHFLMHTGNTQAQLCAWGQPQPTRIIQSEGKNAIGAMAVAPDDRHILLSTRSSFKPEESQWQLALVDAQSGAAVSVTAPQPGMTHRVQLAANGLALVGRFNAGHRLYQFPTAPGDAFARLEPPQRKAADPGAVPVAKKESPKAKEPAPVKVVRVAVPAADKLLAAEKSVRDQFKADYAKKSPADAAALAERLHKLAEDSTDDPPASYVLLREARDLAVRGGKAELTLKIVADMSERFEIDAVAMRADTIAAFANVKLSAATAKQFVEVALQEVGHAAEDDQLDAAQKMLAVAQTVARRANNSALTARVAQQDRQIKEMAKEYAEVKTAREKLAANGADAAANLTVGLYVTFRKGNWAKGLPLLAQGSDTELRDLVKQDLAADDDKARLDIADAWWTAAQARPVVQKAAMQWRAASLYRDALPNLKGLAEAKAKDRIRVAEALPPAFGITAGVGEVARLRGHASFVNALAVSADGKQVYSCSHDGTLRLWYIATGQSRVLLGPPLVRGPLASFALSPDLQQAALLYTNGGWDAFDFATGKRRMGTEQEVIPDLYWRDNSEVHFIDGKTWHTSRPTQRSGGSGPLLFNGPELQGNVRAVVMAPEHDAGALLVAGEQVCVFKIQGPGLRRPHVQIRLEATAAAFPKDGRYIVLGGKGGKLTTYDLQVGMNAAAKEITAFKGHAGTIRAAACTPDGKLVISGGSDKTLRIWDAATGAQLQRFAHPAAVLCVAVTPDARYAISGCADGVIRVWSLPKSSAPTASAMP